jgi:hypothetical protein
VLSQKVKRIYKSDELSPYSMCAAFHSYRLTTFLRIASAAGTNAQNDRKRTAVKKIIIAMLRSEFYVRDKLNSRESGVLRVLTDHKN